jgi:hypothetical protein
MIHHLQQPNSGCILPSDAQSDIVRVNISMASNGQIIQRLRNVGHKAHGIVQLQNGQLLCLDSETAALIMVDPTTGAVTRLWTVSDNPPVADSAPLQTAKPCLWLSAHNRASDARHVPACPLQAPDPGRFLKGLAVVDDVA